MVAKQHKPARDILANEKPILTLRQARRLLGKQTSDSIDDMHLSRMIGAMSSLAESLISTNSVPKIG